MIKYQFSKDYDSEYKIKDKKVACFSKNEMGKQYPDGNYNVVGETIIRNKKDKIGLIELGGIKLRVSEADGHSKILFKTAGYVQIDGGDYLRLLSRRWSLLWILLALLLLLTLAYILFHKPVVAPEPDTKAVESDTVYIFIPEGLIEYRMVNDITSFDGANMELYMKPNEEEVLVHKQKVSLDENDRLVDGQIDFSLLHFELIPGDYSGRMVYKRTGKTDAELPVIVKVRQSNTGEMAIGYSDQIKVNKKTGIVRLKYEQGKNTTHDTMIQVILKRKGREYLLAQSGTVHAGDTVTKLKLTEDGRKLPSGNYDGCIRVFVVSGDTTTADTGADIALHITIQ